jgi:ADP-heptose:LPS heptosyltransferase
MSRLKRLLLIRFQINLFEKPFSGQRDFLKPLRKWGYDYFLPPAPQLFLGASEKERAQEIITAHALFNFFILVPSAAYFLKRWPLEKWHELIKMNPQEKFVILAGKNDTFTSELNIYENVVNLTGTTSLLESAALIEQSRCVITNDTGLLHFAEQLGRPAIALMGPAPFGFPSRSSTKILERNLPCRPCSKHGQGPCKNRFYHECLVTISADEVTQSVQKLLGQSK